MSLFKKSLLVPLFAAVSVISNFPVMASDQVDGDDAQHCISLHRIDSLKVIDNQNLVVKTKDDKLFLNHLSHPCPNLDDRKAIMYKTPLNRLCSHDIITVLDNIGGGFQEFGSCGLGQFREISEEELQYVKEGSL